VRVLLLAPNYRRRVNFGHQLFWDEILRQSPDSLQHGAGNEYYGRSSVKQIFREKGHFDAVLFESMKYCRHYTDLAEVDTIRVGMIGDYFNANIPAYNAHMVKNRPHVVTLQSKGTLENYRKHMLKGVVPKSKLLYVPHSVCPDTFYFADKYKAIDVLAAYSTGSPYPQRSNLLNQLKGMGVKIQEGGWRNGLIHNKYVDAIQRSKMMVCANGYFNEVTLKYLEVMACEVLFVTDKPNDADWFGFKDEHNIVYYQKSSWPDMKNKVARYLEMIADREKIARRGKELVMSRHTNEIRVRDLLKQIKSVMKENKSEAKDYPKEVAT